jgi:hypothetical protein
MNGVLDAGQTVLSNLDKIMTCADSWMAYNAALGQWSIVINKADATSYAFDDDNIIGEVRVSATDITQSINQVEAKFPDKGSRDQPNFVNIATPQLLLYPNEPANKYSVTYDLCNDSVQAQYLANRILEQAREDLIVSFSTTYYGIQVDAGDVVSVTNADYGWTNKLFRVVKVNEASLPDGSLGAKLEMTEYSAAVYDDFNITQYAAVPNSDLPSVNYFSSLSAPNISTSNPTSAIPNFDVTVSIPTVGRVTSVDLFYTTAAIPNPTDWKLLSTATSANGEPLTPGSSYLFSNQVLPTGSGPTETYYFSYVAYSEESKTNLAPISTAFNWSPVPANGLSAIFAYLVQSQSLAAPTFTATTTGATAPAGWSLATPSVAVGQVLWYIDGQFNSSSGTIDGVAPNTTSWTGPIAASIFQDIRSDNWNGSSPPVAATPATWGTDGYYIERANGNIFANGFYARGNSEFAGAESTAFALTNSIKSNTSNSADVGVFSQSKLTGTTFGVWGFSSSTAGIGGRFTAIANSGVGLFAQNTFGGVALQVEGKMQITDSTLVSNLNAEQLGGKTSSAFVQVASGTTNANYLYFLNNNTAPSDPVNRVAWIKISTNDGGFVWLPGYL